MRPYSNDEVHMRQRRYHVGCDLPWHSADGTACVADGKSDNDDVLVHIDPYDILTEAARKKLARIVARALNDADFRPEYPD